METKPYKNIASLGVITDPDPYDLPLGAWSWGQNVRFRNNTVTRGPVLRSVKSSLLSSAPRFLGSIIPSSGLDTMLIGYLNGRVSMLINGVETDVSITGYSNSNADTPFTYVELNDVSYVNRGDRAPWALTPGASIFATLANWAPVSGPWTCNLLRECNNALVALGVTQNGTANPTMVITSEFAAGTGNVPATWNYTLGTNNATQNVLGAMEGPIIDACKLGQNLIIYAQNETWRMFLTGDSNIWGYVPLFKELGAINTNCVVEVDNKHYVFGLNDIWMHDGNSVASIADEKTREFIFNGLNVANAGYCGAAYNKNLKEIYFRYPSSDAFCSFNNGLGSVLGCNRQAVYHIPTGTWTFDDLPFVFGAVMANVSNSKTWATDTSTWATSGGTWASLEGSSKKVMAMIGDVNSTYTLTEQVYAFDLQGPGSLVNFAVDTHATQGWTLIRDGIDLEEVGADLKGYKVISSIIPQARLETGAQPIQFSFGSSDYFNEPVTMSPVQTYDGNTFYKLDYNSAGRYLSMAITHPDYHWVSMTGFDFEMDVLAEF